MLREPKTELPIVAHVSLTMSHRNLFSPAVAPSTLTLPCHLSELEPTPGDQSFRQETNRKTDWHLFLPLAKHTRASVPEESHG